MGRRGWRKIPWRQVSEKERVRRLWKRGRCTIESEVKIYRNRPKLNRDIQPSSGACRQQFRIHTSS